MLLDASRHLWNAQVDPRRRTYAAGLYTHVRNRWSIVYDQPIVLNERQAGAAIDDFRYEIHTVLNRGESVHQLQRAVYSGKVAPERGRRRDGMRAISGSHALLTNIVLAWNTGWMHKVVERLKCDGTRVEDDRLRRVGSAQFSHINLRSTMRFGVERCAEALVQPGPRHLACVAS